MSPIAPQPPTEQSGSLLETLKGNLDATLGVRDAIGAQLYSIAFLRRSWTGDRPGEGTAKDVITLVKPTPQLYEYAHDIRLLEGGSVKQGDILLKNISKNAYPEEAMIDGSSVSTNVENFYLINGKIYNVIQVKSKYVTWDVQLRKLSSQTRY